MRIPDSLVSLVHDGIIDDVVRPLMSGKEAEVYLVLVADEERVAKVYKDAQQRTFKNRAVYTEGRRTRDSRDQRAMGKQSKYGKAQDEAAWRATEYTMILRLQAAGVRVPIPYAFVDGVLVMELVTDAEGSPASRLGELNFTPEEARVIHDFLLSQIVRMLCVGIVHGDLSDFNVLMGANGPVIIDFPQAVDSAVNLSAPELLRRDVDNIHRFLTRFVPNAPRMRYADEMWALYRQDELTPQTVLTGRHKAAEGPADVAGMLELIEDAARDEWQRQTTRGGKPVARALARFGTGEPESGSNRRADGLSATPRDPTQRRPSRSGEAPQPPEINMESFRHDEEIGGWSAGRSESGRAPRPVSNPRGRGGPRTSGNRGDSRPAPNGPGRGDPRPSGGDGRGDQRPPQTNRGDGRGDQRPPQTNRGDGRGDQRPPQTNRGDGRGDQRPPQTNHGDGRGDQRPPQNNRGDGRGDQRPPQNNRGDGRGDQRPPQNNRGDARGDQRPPQNNRGDARGDQRPPQNNRGDGRGEPRVERVPQRNPAPVQASTDRPAADREAAQRRRQRRQRSNPRTGGGPDSGSTPPS